MVPTRRNMKSDEKKLLYNYNRTDETVMTVISKWGTDKAVTNLPEGEGLRKFHKVTFQLVLKDLDN